MAENFQYEVLWNKIKEAAKPHINTFSFSTYIEGLKPVDVVNRKMFLQADTEMAAGTARKNINALREAALSLDVGINDVAIIAEGDEINEEGDAMIEHDNHLNPNYTFESFVVGSSNKFVFAAAKSVAEAPGENFNPLYIYGGTGLGKTHLMQAIANSIQQKKPSLNIIYTTSENFLNEYVDSMLNKRNGTGQAETKFRNRYRNVDILLIDDIQFWAGKRGVQEAFFHAFNDLYAAHKQIVISSDCPAKDLTELEERLRTRFEGGLIADIQPPDLETKIAILKQKALEKRYVVPDDVLSLLAKNSDNNVRTLEGRLNKVIFASKLREEPITMALVQTAIDTSANPESPEQQETVTPQAIIRAACTHFNIKESDLLGKNKRQEYVRARQVCIYLMCEMLALPLVNVGKLMGGRDHSTIIYARDKIVELMRVNDAVLKDVNDIKSVVLKQ